MRAKQWLLLGSVVGALAIVGCGEPKSGVSKENKEYHKETKGAPKWVAGDINHIKIDKVEYDGIYLGRGEEDIVDGDVDYATDLATTKARSALASNLKTELTKEVQEDKARSGGSLSKNSERKIGETVDRVLTASKAVARWVGKDRVWVLVALDKEIFYKVRQELGLKAYSK
ncbi:conserved lipoprotein [Helicobacter heilmannii]|uniref:LPP20 family lipoprotein n=1 Tax=Helicobacter heilmannii TaxID=35817 RepID=UPI0006A03A0E|nr:LPP20 family lipoprotein [Helicobacter heilmannii]CRF47499.1 conserved lipoprotein [Helicobacter heilmannii]